MIEAVEAIATASFLPEGKKLPFIQYAIRKNDTVAILLLILWENKSIDTSKYATLSEKLDAIGRMLGGWQGQIINKNSPAK
jgi:hypothetical protein